MKNNNNNKKILFPMNGGTIQINSASTVSSSSIVSNVTNPTVIHRPSSQTMISSSVVSTNNTNLHKITHQQQNPKHRLLLLQNQQQQQTKISNKMIAISNNNANFNRRSIIWKNNQHNRQKHRKNLWQMFQKYRSEIEELRQYFNAKWSRIKIMEEKINDLILIDEDFEDLIQQQQQQQQQQQHDDQDFGEEDEDQDQVDEDHHMLNTFRNNNRKKRKKNFSFDSKFNSNNHNSNLMMFEPIIDIKIKDDDEDDDLEEETADNNNNQINFDLRQNFPTSSDSSNSINNDHHGSMGNFRNVQIIKNDGEAIINNNEKIDLDENDKDVSLLEPPSPSATISQILVGVTTADRKPSMIINTTTNRNRGAIGSVHSNIHTKNEFLQIVENSKRLNQLIKEKLSPNVVMLRNKEDNTILGYQCSIDDCCYMHFLRAQVNRHFKNFHSKTCSHCNVRFKRPYELSLHLKGSTTCRNKLQQQQSQEKQQEEESPLLYN